MRFFVNDACIGCGLCASTCPEVFELGGDGMARAGELDVSGKTLAEATQAMENCPVSAIGEKDR